MDENKLIESLTRVEESTKAAHKRIHNSPIVEKNSITQTSFPEVSGQGIS